MKRSKYESTVLFTILLLFLIDPAITTVQSKNSLALILMSIAILLLLLAIATSVLYPKKLPW